MPVDVVLFFTTFEDGHMEFEDGKWRVEDGQRLVTHLVSGCAGICGHMPMAELTWPGPLIDAHYTDM